jgi:hypothetical protein
MDTNATSCSKININLPKNWCNYTQHCLAFQIAGSLNIHLVCVHHTTLTILTAQAVCLLWGNNRRSKHYLKDLRPGVTHTVSHRPLAAEIKLQTQASQYGICGRQSGTATDVSPSTPIFRTLYQFTIAPHSFIHSLIHLHVRIITKTNKSRLRTFTKQRS